MAKIHLSSTSDTGFLKAQRRNLKGEAKWKDIEDLINRWARRNPQGALLNEQWVKEAQAGLKDKKHGLMGGKSKNGVNIPGTRIGISIHPELMNYIQAFYPEFMDTKSDLHQFKKRFPKFRVPESV